MSKAAKEAFKRFADHSGPAALMSRGLSERHFGQGIFFVYRELHRSLHRACVHLKVHGGVKGVTAAYLCGASQPSLRGA